MRVVPAITALALLIALPRAARPDVRSLTLAIRLRCPYGLAG